MILYYWPTQAYVKGCEVSDANPSVEEPIYGYCDGSSNLSRLKGDSYDSILVIVVESNYIVYVCVSHKDLLQFDYTLVGARVLEERQTSTTNTNPNPKHKNSNC